MITPFSVGVIGVFFFFTVLPLSRSAFNHFPRTFLDLLHLKSVLSVFLDMQHCFYSVSELSDTIRDHGHFISNKNIVIL